MDQQGQFSCVYLVSPPPNPHQPGFHCCPSLELNPPAFCRPSAGFKGWYLYDNSLLYRNIQRTVGLLLKCCWLSKRAISAALKGLLWELLNSGYFLIEYFQGTNCKMVPTQGYPALHQQVWHLSQDWIHRSQIFQWWLLSRFRNLHFLKRHLQSISFLK